MKSAIENVIDNNGDIPIEVELSKLVPNHGMIIVRKERRQKVGRIELPDSVQQPMQVGTAIAVYDECKIEVGRKVVFRKGAGTDLDFMGLSDITVLMYSGKDPAMDDVICFIRD